MDGKNKERQTRDRRCTGDRSGKINKRWMDRQTERERQSDEQQREAGTDRNKGDR